MIHTLQYKPDIKQTTIKPVQRREKIAVAFRMNEEIPKKSVWNKKDMNFRM